MLKEIADFYHKIGIKILSSSIYETAVDLGKPEIVFDLGPMPNPNAGKATFDFNALGQYISPKEIRMRKLRQRAKKHLKELDELYPILIEK